MHPRPEVWQQLLGQDGVQLLAAHGGVVGQLIFANILNLVGLLNFRNDLQPLFLVVLALQFLLDHVTVILANIHMYLIKQPAHELVTVMVVVVVEFTFACSDACYESLVIYHATIPFCILYIFEKLLNFVDEVVLFLIEGLPSQDLITERSAVEQHLYRRVDVTYVRILRKNKDKKSVKNSIFSCK